VLKPTIIAGPWKGLITAVEPQSIPGNTVSAAENVWFKNGQLMSSPGFGIIGQLPKIITWKDYPEDPLTYDEGVIEIGETLKNIWHVEEVTRTNNTPVYFFFTKTDVYMGGSQYVKKITPEGFELRRTMPPTFVHVVTEIDELVLFTNGYSPVVWVFDLIFDRVARPLRNKQNRFHLPMTSAKYMTLFGDRTILGNLRMAEDELPHAIGWFGINGPLDTSFPTAGIMPLTDDPGEVTGFARFRDFLVVMKSSAVYLLQKTYNANQPVRPVGRGRPGCFYPRSIVTLPNNVGVIYMSEDRQVCLFDGETVHDIGLVIQPTLNSLNITPYTFASLDAENSLYRLIAGDRIATFNFKDNWWSTEKVDGFIVNVLDKNLEKGPFFIDMYQEGFLSKKINGLNIQIDNLHGVSSVKEPIYVTNSVRMKVDPRSVKRFFIKTAEFRFPKPTTISRLVLRVRSLDGGSILIRHSLDNGGTWSPTTDIWNQPINRSTLVPYNFVATSNYFVFEIEFVGASLVIHDAVADIIVDNEQEHITPLNIDGAAFSSTFTLT